MRDVTDPERSSEPTKVGYSPNCWFILFTAKQKNILFTKGGERGNEKKKNKSFFSSKWRRQEKRHSYLV